jgi:hypothetical protein
MRHKECLESSFSSVSIDGIAHFLAGYKADFLLVVTFVKQNEIGSMPCLVCVLIEPIKRIAF